jgi:hypothetical protein
VSPLFCDGCIRLITLIYGSKRCCILPCTSKYDRFTARISLEITGVLRRIRTAIYGRNTVPTKRVSHGPYTVVIIMYTDVFAKVNNRKLSFAIVVTLDLGVLTIVKKFFFNRFSTDFINIRTSEITSSNHRCDTDSFWYTIK